MNVAAAALSPHPNPSPVGDGRGALRAAGQRHGLCDTAAMSPTQRGEHRHNVPAARDLRQRGTPAEELLWDALRNRRLDGLKFRRQHPVGPFVIDFCCPSRQLAIELDGEVHVSQC